MTHRNTLLVSMLLAALLLISGSAFAQVTPEYRVTIYNLTYAQPISPPLVAAHTNDVAIFEIGQPAIPELATLAEDGSPASLAELLGSLSQVADVATAGGPIGPGGAAEIMVSGARPFHRLSIVGMLVNTNDAFFGIDTITAPRRRFESVEVYGLAYDAGSEANNEDCDFIPGPACAGAGAGVRDEGDAEGFIHIHRGIHGTADLDPAAHDWRNPVVKIVITRVR